MKKIITITYLLLGLNFYAQTIFEKGYYITLEGNKVECLIKNEDWVFAPSKIYYKINKTSIVNEISSKQISKLVIPNKFVFERHFVNIERQNPDINRLTKSRTFNYIRESLLLKVIVDGKAKLLKYNNDNTDYFFYRKNKKIEPLEFKIFKSQNGILLKNMNYQLTLKQKLSCENNSLNNKIKYDEKELVDYFIKYNNCFGSESNIYSNQSKSGIFNIRAKGAVGMSSAEYIRYNTNATITYKFDTKLAFKIGLEFEYIFTFNNNKWSALIEPTYQSFQSESQSSNLSLEYNSIELPIGLRHYFYTKNSSFFVDGGFSLDFPTKGNINNNNIDEIVTLLNYFVGLGYNLNKKINLSVRYNTPRDLIRLSSGRSLNFENFSLLLGYTIR